MNFKQSSLEWYYSLKAMDEAIENKIQHALFVLTSYQNIKDSKFPWIKEPINKEALIRTVEADIIAQAFKSIESLFTIAMIGLRAEEENIFDHKKMKDWFFEGKWDKIENQIKKLKNINKIGVWKWALWIADIEEANKQMNLTADELKMVKSIYAEYIERAEFIFTSALEFWRLYKPVRNAFSHTLRFIPSPRISGLEQLPKGYQDMLLVLDKTWKNKNPIKIPVVMGSRSIKIIAELITNFNLFEQSIIKNHTISIQANGKRLIPTYIIGRENEERQNQYRKLEKKIPKFLEINVNWKHDFDAVKEIKPQIELYEDFRNKLIKLGKFHPYSVFGKISFPRSNKQNK